MVCLLQVDQASRFGLLDWRMKFQVGEERTGRVGMTVSNIYKILNIILNINSNYQTNMQGHKVCVTVIKQITQKFHTGGHAAWTARLTFILV